MIISMAFLLSIYIISLHLLSSNGVAKDLYSPELRCEESEGDVANKVFLIDHLLETDELEYLNKLLAIDRKWILNYGGRDDKEGSSLEMYSKVPWISPLSPQLFQDFKVWKRLEKLLKRMTATQYYICHAMFTKSYRMNFNEINQGEGNNWTVRIFLNDDMKKNHYGETVFYTKNSSDVLCGIYPTPGRVLIWNGSISYAAKPPSMLFLQSQNSIVIKLTDSYKKYQTCLEHFETNKKVALPETKMVEFPFTLGQLSTLQSIQHGDIDFDNHLTKKHFDSRGYEIAIFDDVLTKEDLDILRAHLVKDYNSFKSQPYDTDTIEDHDNVAWISTLKVDALVQSDLWKVVKGAVKYLSGLDQWYPYDVSMNIIHSYDHTRIHEDCEKHEYEYTFLLYLNPEWGDDFYGETLFFDLVNSSSNNNPGDEEYEIVTAVSPRYGRIALFRGIIPHSARPASPKFKGPRYTFACKVSKTYRTSTAKQLQETIERFQYFGIEDDEHEQLMEELQRGEHNVKSEGRPDDFLETELMKQRNIFKKYISDYQNDLLRKLSH